MTKRNALLSDYILADSWFPRTIAILHPAEMLVPDETVFAMDVEMVEGVVNGVRQNLAGRVVLVRNDRRTEWIKVLDIFIRYPEGMVTNYMTRWSKLEEHQMSTGIDRQIVVDFLLNIIHGHKLVVFSGASDFRALGVSRRVIELFATVIELQDYFRRDDGTPYGLGPLVDYFGYRRMGRQVIIRHNCVDDAVYTLRLYLDHYSEDFEFIPETRVLTKREYNNKYNLF